MLSQLSQYQFLFNILLMFISVLQIAVTNETRERKQVSEQELQRSRKDSTYQIIKASLSASVARFRSGLGFSQSSDRNDLTDSSVTAALRVIDALQAQGYEFLTVSELAARSGTALTPGQAYCSFPP